MKESVQNLYPWVISNITKKDSFENIVTFNGVTVKLEFLLLFEGTFYFAVIAEERISYVEIYGKNNT